MSDAEINADEEEPEEARPKTEEGEDEEEIPEWLRSAAEQVSQPPASEGDASSKGDGGTAAGVVAEWSGALTEDFRCDYCDAETSNAVGIRLLDLIAARRAEGNKRAVDDLVQKFVREKLLPPKKPSKRNAPPPDLNTLHAALDEAGVPKASGLGGLFTSKDELAKRFDKERKELDASFRHSHRMAVAAELIAAYDPDCQWHCGAVVRSGEARSVNAAEQHRIKCIFRPLACRNEGCVYIHSALHEGRHDRECAHKLLPCTRECGLHVKRKDMGAHVDGPCPNRPCDCPFVHLGCDVPCTQGTLEAHLEAHVHQHLSLTLRVVTQQQRSLNELQAAQAAQAALSTSSAAQQKELIALRGRVDTLEQKRDEMQEGMRASEQELRAALAKAKADLGAASGKDVRRAEEGLGKQVKAVASAAKDETTRLAAAHERLRGTVEAVSARLAELERR